MDTNDCSCCKIIYWLKTSLMSVIRSLCSRVKYLELYKFFDCFLDLRLLGVFKMISKVLFDVMFVEI